jgi:hypothetical protein
MWLEIDALRRAWPSPSVPAEVEIVRTLLREALDARQDKKPESSGRPKAIILEAAQCGRKSQAVSPPPGLKNGPVPDL